MCNWVCKQRKPKRKFVSKVDEKINLNFLIRKIMKVLFVYEAIPNEHHVLHTHTWNNKKARAEQMIKTNFHNFLSKCAFFTYFQLWNFLFVFVLDFSSISIWVVRCEWKIYSEHQHTKLNLQYIRTVFQTFVCIYVCMCKEKNTCQILPAITDENHNIEMVLLLLSYFDVSLFRTQLNSHFIWWKYKWLRWFPFSFNFYLEFSLWIDSFLYYLFSNLYLNETNAQIDFSL